MYHKRVDEQLIQERTGHRSVETVRKCKRTLVELQVGVSELLQSGAEAPATKPRSPRGKEDLQSLWKMHIQEPLIIALSISISEMSMPFFFFLSFRICCPLHICVLSAFYGFIGLAFFLLSSSYLSLFSVHRLFFAFIDFVRILSIHVQKTSCMPRQSKRAVVSVIPSSSSHSVCGFCAL